MKIVVIGGSGLIGKKLVARLHKFCIETLKILKLSKFS
jgi:uncharacterized protein YbjT (DUF2867 family)